VPFFGICLGLHCLVVEYARNMAGIEHASSEEFDPDSPDKIIYLMSSWYDPRSGQMQYRDAGSNLGGTMRLGSYPCRLLPGSLAHQAYRQDVINERHRHRYEFNQEYLEPLQRHGLVFSGFSPDNTLVEIVELSDHPWFLACQFHPEFKSQPMNPHPLFRDFIAAATRHK
jgi:CTP synthase